MNKEIALIEIPKWGLSMEEGTVNQWLINEGDSFEAGTELVEIESSKIVNVVEAHFAGTLRRILAGPGTSLPVGAPIAVAADAAVSDAAIDAFLAAAAPPGEIATTPAPDTTPIQPAATQQNAPRADQSLQVPESLRQGEDDSALHATLHARRLAGQLGINLHNVTPTGRNGRISRNDVEQAITTAGGRLGPSRRERDKPGPSTRDDSEVAATPVARRLAAQLGINLHDCRASGSRGRVAKADVEAAHRAAGAQTTAAIPAAVADTENPPIPVPMDAMRKTIATRLQQSKQNAPHFRLTVTVAIDKLLAVRKQINTTHSNAKVSINDFVIKATAAALMQVPECNIQFDGTTLTRFADADIAVAVALERGLITPIIRRANRKGLLDIAGEVRDLTTRAKAGTLNPDEFQGGTFSISNLGMYGIRQFDAVINPPQGAILAVGSGEERVVVVNGAPAVATVMTLTLSCDHRVIDGATGARLLQALQAFLQDPAMMIA